MRALRNALGLLLGMLVGSILLPFVVLVKLLLWPFAKGANWTQVDVTGYIQAALHGEWNDKWNWEDFEQVPIRDPRLEGIRKRAISVRFPLSVEDRELLRTLLQELESTSS